MTSQIFNILFKSRVKRSPFPILLMAMLVPSRDVPKCRVDTNDIGEEVLCKYVEGVFDIIIECTSDKDKTNQYTLAPLEFALFVGLTFFVG